MSNLGTAPVVLNTLTGDITLAAGAGISITSVGNTITITNTGGGGGGVSSLNSLVGAVTLSAGSGISLVPTGNDILISALGIDPTIIGVKAATTAALAASTYNNGASGVGATLTKNTNGALPTQDTVTLTIGDRLLVKNQASALQNGVYVVTQLGAAGGGGSPWILTRSTDADTTAELDMQEVAVALGSANANTVFNQTTVSPVVGTDPIVYLATGGVVRQQAAGTQVSGQIPYWTGVARQLSRGDSRFTRNISTFQTLLGKNIATNVDAALQLGTFSIAGPLTLNGSLLTLVNSLTGNKYFVGVGDMSTLGQSSESTVFGFRDSTNQTAAIFANLNVGDPNIFMQTYPAGGITQGIQFNQNTTGARWQKNGHSLFTIDAGGFYDIGDQSGALGNGTHIELDDFDNFITFYNQSDAKFFIDGVGHFAGVGIGAQSSASAWDIWNSNPSTGVLSHVSSGLDDATLAGDGGASLPYQSITITIIAGTPDQFTWTQGNSSSLPVAIVAATPFPIGNTGTLTIEWAADTGHDNGAIWTITGRDSAISQGYDSDGQPIFTILNSGETTFYDASGNAWMLLSPLSMQANFGVPGNPMINPSPYLHISYDPSNFPGQIDLGTHNNIGSAVWGLTLDTQGNNHFWSGLNSAGAGGVSTATWQVNNFTSPFFSGPFFTGVGLNDMIAVSVNTQIEPITFFITIDGTGTPDTFSYTGTDGSSGFNISITGSGQMIGTNNVTIQFFATTGHTLLDQWQLDVIPQFVDISTNSQGTILSELRDDGYFRMLDSNSNNRFSIDPANELTQLFTNGAPRVYLDGVNFNYGFGDVSAANNGTAIWVDDGENALYLGPNPHNNSVIPIQMSIQPTPFTNGLLTDQAGVDTTIMGGSSTGTGVGGTFRIATYPAAAMSGNNRNTPEDIMTFNTTNSELLKGKVESAVLALPYGSSVNATPKQLRISFGTSGSGANTVNLPSGTNAPIGTIYIIKDIGLGALTNNITVNADTGNVIVGTTSAQTYVMNVNGQSATFVKITATQWQVE